MNGDIKWILSNHHNPNDLNKVKWALDLKETPCRKFKYKIVVTKPFN